MTCKDMVRDHISRLWMTGPAEWGSCDHIFDLKNDDVINIFDSVMVENLTESECCDLMRSYNECMGFEDPGYSTKDILVYAGIAVIVLLIIIILLR